MDIYKAYLLACCALGTLRVVQGWRWTSGRSAPLNEVHVGLEALWAIVSVSVLAVTDALQIQGVVIWYVLGSLCGWLLLRPRARHVLPLWYQEYLIWFGLGLAGLAVNALVRYTAVEPMPLLLFVSQPVGLVWLLGSSVLVGYTIHEAAAGLMQRSFDKGVLGGLRGHPQCSELFGDIQLILRKHEESARVTGEDVLVYRVEGSRAAGVVVAEFREASDQVNEVVQGLVYMDTGERTSLNVGSGLS